MSLLSGKVSLRSLTLGFIAVAAVAVLPAHADSQARIVRLSDVQGSVQIDKNSGMGFENAFLNLPVTQGSQIQTRANGRAEIEFEDGSTMRLASNSRVEFSTLGLSDAGARLSVINLVDGTAYVTWLGKSSDQFTLNFSREKVELDRAAAHFRVNTSPGLAKFAVFKGEVQVAGPAGSVTVNKKKMVTFEGDADKATLASLAEEPLDSWDKESTSYHDQYSKNNSSPYGYGVSDLNYYGSYTSVPGYGTMWQPYFTGVGWDPFMDGAWSWYPGFGYTFVSAYPWGWAPYRYGNWAFVPGFGWMWQPGYGNGWVTVPRYSAASTLAFHRPIAPTGAVGTVVVGRGGPVSSSLLPSHMTLTQGSAGMGVARGTLSAGSLKSLNHQVAKSGFAEVRPAPQFAASAAARSNSSAGPSRASSYGGNISSAGHASGTASSHASSGSGHH